MGCTRLQLSAEHGKQPLAHPKQTCEALLPDPEADRQQTQGCAGTSQQVSAAFDSPALTVEHHNGPLRRIAQVLKHAIKVQAHGLRIKVPAQQTGGKGFGQGARSYA